MSFERQFEAGINLFERAAVYGCSPEDLVWGVEVDGVSSGVRARLSGVCDATYLVTDRSGDRPVRKKISGASRCDVGEMRRICRKLGIGFEYYRRSGAHHTIDMTYNGLTVQPTLMEPHSPRPYSTSDRFNGYLKTLGFDVEDS